MTSQPITDFVKRKQLPWVFAAGALNSIFGYLTFGASVLVLFLRELGFNKGRIGLILSLFPFCGLIALIVAPWAERMGVKRVFIAFYGARKFVLMFLLAVPLLLDRYGVQISFYVVTAIILLFALLRAIAETAALTWGQEYVPNSIRGRVGALNSILSGITGMAALAAAGYVLNRFTGLPRYVWLMTAGCVLGFLGVLCMLPVPGGAPLRRGADTDREAYNPAEALRDREFRQFLLGMGFHVVGFVMLQSFAPLFMIEQVGLSASQAVLLDAGMLLGGLLIAGVWGWAADRFGSKPVLVSCLGIVTSIPLLWTFLPRQSPWSFPSAMGIALLFGIGLWGVAVGHGTLLYNRIVPASKRTTYLAIYYAWAGITAGIAPLAAGGILQRMQAYTADPYIPLFMIGLAMIFLAINMYSRINMQGEQGTRAFIGMLFQANPLQVIRNVMSHSSSRDETQRMDVVQRIGDIHSTLNEKELLIALQDPSFNVRFEAVVAAARMPPTRELVQTLLSILRHRDAELSTTAAWALGRLDVHAAIPALREALDAPFPSLRQRAMRSLGMLNDQAAIPRLTATVSQALDEDSPAHRMDAHAAICALGSLKTRTAIPSTLRFMALYPSDDDARRHELLLSIARMMDLEAPFIHLWRTCRHERGSSLAEATEQTEKKWRLLGRLHAPFLLALQSCIDLFARDDFANAWPQLAGLLRDWPDILPDTTFKLLIATCGQQLENPGPHRLDYAILALVLLGSHPLESHAKLD